MISIEQFLKNLFSQTGRIVLLGVGSHLMGDDAAGVTVTDRLIQHLGENIQDRFFILSGANAPECLTGVIKSIKPDRVLIIDAADIKADPGECIDIDPAVVSGVSFSTHMLPLKVMLVYLQKEIGCQTVILGIQPACLEFGSDMTPRVQETVEELVQTIRKIIEDATL